METDFGPVCRQHLEFMQWADDIMLAALSQIPHDKQTHDLGNSFKSLLGTLNHVYLGELVWFKRVTDDPNALIGSLKSPSNLDELGNVWPKLHQQWIDWSRSFSTEDWTRIQIGRAHV